MDKNTMGRKRNDPLLELNDAAHLLDLSPAELVDLIAKKKLKAIKRGDSWLLSRSDVEAAKGRR